MPQLIQEEIPFPFESKEELCGPQKSEDEFVGAVLIWETGFISGRGRNGSAFVGPFCLLPPSPTHLFHNSQIMCRLSSGT